MATQRALVLTSRDQPISLQEVPRPTAKAGEAVVRVLSSTIVPYVEDVLTGKRPYPLSLPLIPGGSAIGRVVEIGPDAVGLQPGQLVFCDMTIRARDDPNVSILIGSHNGGYPAAQRLMDGEWRNGTYAEYAKFPLENLYPLNEEVLLKERGYSPAQLTSMAGLMVPFGGLSDIDVKAGEVVIVAPATGWFGGAAVAAAVSMGALVIAAGRNTTVLEKIDATYRSTGRLRTVILTGGASADTEALKRATPSGQGADAYIDFCPPGAKGTSLIASTIAALRPSGRCVLMGGIMGNAEIPHWFLVHRNIRVQGRYMYDRKHVLQFIQLVEVGAQKLGQDIGVTIQEFGLDAIDQALKAIAKSWSTQVVLSP